MTITSLSYPVLEVSNLRISFRQNQGVFEAVKGISFSLNPGQTLAIVGESGSGKSVSALSLMGLLPERTALVHSSLMRFDGAELGSIGPSAWNGLRGNRMAMIFQEPMTSLNPVMRCGEQVAEAILLYRRASRAEAREQVLDLFRQVLLPREEQVFRAWPHELSGGQKQRVMIAMALANNPKLLIADEPTTALDVTVQKEILQLLAQLREKHGMAVIFITHDLGVVGDIADHVAVMHQGVIVEQGSAISVLQHPENPYTKGLLACRPPRHKRFTRLPVVSEFLDGKWNDSRQMLFQLELPQEQRRQYHSTIYTQQPLLSVKELSVHFKLPRHSGADKILKAVDNLTFDIYPGETLGLVGESGSGKTTLGRSILHLIMPTSGKVYYRNEPIEPAAKRRLKQLRRKMQIVFQDPFSSLNPRITAGEAIREPMQVHGLNGSRKSQTKKVIELLERVGLLPEHYYRYPHEFSGGQRQRIGIARALAVKPEFIVLDEPVSALDVSVQAQVLNLLAELKDEFRLTYLFISHDLGLVRYFSDRVMVMWQGSLVEMGEADSVFYYPKSPYTRKLIDALPGQGLKTLVE
jgi:peptide/nickel transport system ATP-binding protein